MVKTNQEIAQNLFWWTKQTIKEEKKFSESQTGQRKSEKTERHATMEQMGLGLF